MATESPQHAIFDIKKTVDITVGGGQKLTLAWELLGRDVQNQTILSDGNRMSIQKI